VEIRRVQEAEVGPVERFFVLDHLTADDIPTPSDGLRSRARAVPGLENLARASDGQIREMLLRRLGNGVANGPAVGMVATEFPGPKPAV